MTDRSIMEMASGAPASLHNRWTSVMKVNRMWPGEYENTTDSCGDVHSPWSVNLKYFECCTGTPCADEIRSSAFVATSLKPKSIAKKLMKSERFKCRTLEVERNGDDDEVHVKEGSVILFSIQSQDDAGVGGRLCTITAFSSYACESLLSVAKTFDRGACSIVPHGFSESTIETKLGPMRLVRIVGIDKNATDSERLAAHFTIEDDSAAAYQPPPAGDGRTLADHVVSRCIMSFRNGGWESCIAPTIEPIVTRRDYHGNDLTKCLFDVVEGWFLSMWTLDTKEGGRMMQVTQLTNMIVDGVPTPAEGGGGGKEGGPAAMDVDGGGAAVEPGTCHGLTAVTDKQFFYNMSGFLPNPPAVGTMAEMMSMNHRKEDEAMKMHAASGYGPVNIWTLGGPDSTANQKMKDMRWRSCDFCLTTETKEKPLKVCSRCSCERFYAGRYCNKHCQAQHHGTHKLVCGKTRRQINEDFKAFKGL